jgi:ribosomal protein S18 acetylase RimI-like enzyme
MYNRGAGLGTRRRTVVLKIRPIALKDAESYRRCWDAVAKERRYVTEHKAPPLSEARAQLRQTLREKNPFLVAVDGKRVVGWAAVFRFGLPSLSHNGKFGIALLPKYRDMGLGTKLLAAILKMARGKFRVLTLEVFGKNRRAQKLYRKIGFETCGRIKTYVKGLAYGSDDALLMQRQMGR